VIAAVVIAASLWASEPRGQEYVLPHGSRVVFWVADERPPAYGAVCYLWGYFPVIAADNGGVFEFSAVSWRGGEL
jgi:hypothetical protein